MTDVSRLTINDLPEPGDDAEIAPLLTELRRSLEGRDRAHRELLQLRDDREAARVRDGAKAAAALSSGKKPPSTSEVERAEKKFSDCERVIAGYTTLVANQHADLSKVLAEHGATIAARQARGAAVEAEEVLGLLDMVERHVATIVALGKVGSWAQDWPRSFQNASGPPVAVQLGDSRAGAAVTWGELREQLDALGPAADDAERWASAPRDALIEALGRAQRSRCAGRDRAGRCPQVEGLELRRRDGRDPGSITAQADAAQFVLLCPTHVALFAERAAEREERMATA